MKLTSRPQRMILPALASILGATLACSAPAALPTPTRTPVPATLAPTVPPTPTLPPDWASVGPGIELRALPIPAEDKPGGGSSMAATVVVLRIDPGQADVTVHYDKDTPLQVGGWATRLQSLAGAGLGPLVVINAGYFQEDYTPAGLVVAGGERFGQTFQGSDKYREGMLSVVGGAFAIRELAGQPYDPAEPLDQAVQGLPMLIEDGAPVTFDLPDRAASRTAVALDGQGRLLLIHVGNGAITLTRLRDWLLSQGELGIVTALNLDGGASTGMAVDGPYPVHDDSVSRVPSVLAVSAR